MNKDINIATLIISSNTYPANRNSKAQKKLFFQQGFNPQLTYWYKAGNKKELKGKKFKVNKNRISNINMNAKNPNEPVSISFVGKDGEKKQIIFQ